MSDTTSPSYNDTSLKWYQGIPRYAWIVLILATLGWMFDAMDQHLFNLVRQSSVTELLAAKGLQGEALNSAAKTWGGSLTSVFLVGWAVGGFIFGILGDKMGRSKTMVITILIYAVFTGLNGLVTDVYQYALCRFLTALGVGGEFAAGAALVSEVWPNRSRPAALGTLQALSAVGNMTAAIVSLFLSATSWRWVFAFGALPALLVVWIRRSVKEPETWVRLKEKTLEGEVDDPAKRELGNIVYLFQHPTFRRNAIAGVLMALAGVGGTWGVGYFLPDLLGKVMPKIVKTWPDIMSMAGKPQEDAIKAAVQAIRSKGFFCQQVGALCGMLTYTVFSQRIGRKPALAIFFVLAFLSVQAAFWLISDPLTAYTLAFVLGFCATAPYAAYAVFFPELFPTRLRATGIGICYNCGRILAAGAPIALTSLAASFQSPTDDAYGFRVAAAIVSCIYVVGFIGLSLAPETKGKPLPE